MLEMKGREFYLDGKKFNIYSGAMHYFRMLPEYWEDRLTKLKLAGFNTVETYVAWNVHEPKKGEFYFEGRYDLVKFLQIAKKVGLYAIVRPGPYICAEWDFGGFPAWLLKDETIRLRCYEETYIRHVTDFFNELLPRLKNELVTNGGNIIAMQIENEYGSYATDKKYLRYLRDLIKSNGVDVTLFTSDGESKYHFSGGALKEELIVANLGSHPNIGLKDLKEYQPDKPLMCGEFWCGWFDHFGERHHGIRNANYLNQVFDEFFENDANFNFYMFHGGTNFGFTAGANYHDRYCPTTTGYDYGAPLSEYGDYTSKYHVIRKKLCEKQNIPLTKLPDSPKLQNIGKVSLSESANLLEHLEKLSTHHKDHIVHYMEHYDQNFGMILYHTEIEGTYLNTTITAEGVHDIAYVYINGKYAGKYDRTKKTSKGKYEEKFTFPLPAFDGKCSVDILVEGMGRINFAKKIYDRKGIASAMVGEQYLYDWDIYTIPLDDLKSLVFDKSEKSYPMFLKGTFSTKSNDDCFVDMKGFTKGMVYVNGFNLGRYWNIGPQRTLYLPGAILKKENEIIVLEQEECRNKEINIIDKPIYGKFDKNCIKDYFKK